MLSTYMKATSALHMITLKEAKNVANEALSKDNERGEKLRQQAQKVVKDLEDVMEFKEALNTLYRKVMYWLILMELDPKQVEKAPAAVSSLIGQCEASRAVWLHHINFTIDAFIENQST